MQIIDNGSGQTNSVSDTPNGFDGHIGIKLRGESSLNFNQKKYTIETWDAQGNDSTVSIFGMPEESDWSLAGSLQRCLYGARCICVCPLERDGPLGTAHPYV